MLFDISRLQNDDLLHMEPVFFARFRRTNKTMLDYVESNARHIGVRIDYPFINLLVKKKYSRSIHSGYSFDHITCWGNDDYFTTRKCRTIHLNVPCGAAIPPDVIIKLGPPRDITWTLKTLPTIPKGVLWLKLLLVKDIVDWKQFDDLETCVVVPRFPRFYVPALRSINCLLEHWHRGDLEKMRRFQNETGTWKDMEEINNRESFLSTLTEQLPTNLIEKMEFTEINEDDQKKWKVSMMASTRISREDGAVAIIAAYERPDTTENKYLSTIRCQIRFHVEEPVTLLPPTWFNKCKWWPWDGD